MKGKVNGTGGNGGDEYGGWDGTGWKLAVGEGPCVSPGGRAMVWGASVNVGNEGMVGTPATAHAIQVASDGREALTALIGRVEAVSQRVSSACAMVLALVC